MTWDPGSGAGETPEVSQWEQRSGRLAVHLLISTYLMQL